MSDEKLNLTMSEKIKNFFKISDDGAEFLKMNALFAVAICALTTIYFIAEIAIIATFAAWIVYYFSELISTIQKNKNAKKETDAEVDAE